MSHLLQNSNIASLSAIPSISSIPAISDEKDLSIRLKNINTYKNIVPEELHNMFDPTFNESFNNALSKDKYKLVATLKAKYLAEIIKLLQPSMVFDQSSLFNVIKMGFDSNFEIVTNYNFDTEESVPFHIQIIPNGLVCDFPEITTLRDKFSKYPYRYFSYEIVFVCPDKGSSHSVLFVFDLILSESYVVDSNGDLSYFDNIYRLNKHTPTRNYLHSALSTYSELIGFKYIKLSDKSIDTSINIRIRSQSQKNFFEGYCRGWTLFFQHILLTKSDTSFDFPEFLEQFCSYDINILNEIVEIYQLYYLDLYKHTNKKNDIRLLLMKINQSELTKPDQPKPNEIQPYEPSDYLNPLNPANLSYLIDLANGLDLDDGHNMENLVKIIDLMGLVKPPNPNVAPQPDTKPNPITYDEFVRSYSEYAGMPLDMIKMFETDIKLAYENYKSNPNLLSNIMIKLTDQFTDRFNIIFDKTNSDKTNSVKTEPEYVYIYDDNHNIIDIVEIN